jgi:septal ring factor EnvC (AmiA/AmiB activator)
LLHTLLCSTLILIADGRKKALLSEQLTELAKQAEKNEKRQKADTATIKSLKADISKQKKDHEKAEDKLKIELSNEKKYAEELKKKYDMVRLNLTQEQDRHLDCKKQYDQLIQEHHRLKHHRNYKTITFMY